MLIVQVVHTDLFLCIKLLPIDHLLQIRVAAVVANVHVNEKKISSDSLPLQNVFCRVTSRMKS